MMVKHKKPVIKDGLKHGLQYVLVPTRNRLSAGKECYSARVRHNENLDAKQIGMELEKRCKVVDGPLAEYIVKTINSILVENIQRGNKVTFGGFTVGLSIRGGLLFCCLPDFLWFCS